ncbi:hypothetical protein P170DRAFT_221187 [Aspergillus steynii IBT 23096]|uniref:Uncharacterized protein n=1 Tax=Aspergillus steynii IBT 23096 TaxID=1392250 RepID=A0A2I2G1H5_9EURO|nr:uncharacterized protein P170DRAFT_221187 [Aspergillus steynii IBT 23096]PLB46729.1 hypothetical protein P170DRAFT_221187 [Aspergillus steynii IBT 23096]
MTMLCFADYGKIVNLSLLPCFYYIFFLYIGELADQPNEQILFISCHRILPTPTRGDKSPGEKPPNPRAGTRWAGPRTSPAVSTPHNHIASPEQTSGNEGNRLKTHRTRLGP